MSILSDRAASQVAFLDDRLLQTLTAAFLSGESAERLSLIAHGDGDQLAPWQILTDPTVAPLWALPYAAQYTGGIMPVRRAGESDDAYTERARAEIVHPRGMLRGGPTSLEVIARAFLTEPQTIRVVQMPDGDLWSAEVLVEAAQVTDLTALEQALNDPVSLPAGFKITVSTSIGPLIDEANLLIGDVADGVTIDGATLADVTGVMPTIDQATRTIEAVDTGVTIDAAGLVDVTGVASTVDGGSLAADPTGETFDGGSFDTPGTGYTDGGTL